MILSLTFLSFVVHAGGISKPRTFLWESDLLVESKLRVNRGDNDLKPAMETLLSQSSYWYKRYLGQDTINILSKPSLPPSGNIRDFYSLGTYFFPNPPVCGNASTVGPDNSTCWPWVVVENGLVNPVTFEYDSVPISQVVFAVGNLSLAYWYTGEEKYAEAATGFISDFFLNETTGMRAETGEEHSTRVRRSL